MRTLAPGMALMVLGLLLLANQGQHAGYFPGIFLAFLLLGLGAGTAFMPLITVAMSEVPRQDSGLASGIVNVSNQISAAVGLALLGTIATHHTKTLVAQGDALPGALLSGYHLAFYIAAASVAVGLTVALVVLRPPDAPASQEAGEARATELATQPA
jgi:MFS family permease